MSEIVSKILESKTARIINLVALATNQHQTARGNWKWEAQADPKLAALEANLSDSKHELYGQDYAVLGVVRGMYALEGKSLPHIRSIHDIPSYDLEYGVALVPTAPVLGDVPQEYDVENNDEAYVIGLPVLCISTWHKSENPNQRARGSYNAVKDLKSLYFLPRRADLTRTATDTEITALVTALVEGRGVAFVDDVLQNLENRYAHLLK